MTGGLYDPDLNRMVEALLSIQSRSKVIYRSSESILNYLNILNAMNPCDPRIQLYGNDMKVLMNDLKTSIDKIQIDMEALRIGKLI